MLANKLKRVFSNIISSCQLAFIRGRQILDGVTVICEIVDFAKRRKEEYILLKVGFEKTYDSISWNFLFYMMDKMGFSRNWIR